MKFCIMDFADLVTFNEEILNENFIFCAVFITHKKSNIYIYIYKKNFRKFSKQEGFKCLYADGSKYNKLLIIVPIVEIGTKLHIIFPS